jgi:hypothetical protein
MSSGAVLEYIHTEKTVRLVATGVSSMILLHNGDVALIAQNNIYIYRQAHKRLDTVCIQVTSLVELCDERLAVVQNNNTIAILTKNFQMLMNVDVQHAYSLIEYKPNNIMILQLAGKVTFWNLVTNEKRCVFDLYLTYTSTVRIRDSLYIYNQGNLESLEGEKIFLLPIYDYPILTTIPGAIRCTNKDILSYTTGKGSHKLLFYNFTTHCMEYTYELPNDLQFIGLFME